MQAHVAPRPPPRASAPAGATAPSTSASLGGFRDLGREHGFEPLRVEGRLPAELRGTLWRAGPALFSTYGRRYDHWFDGDGAVYGTRFDGGVAQGAARIVETTVLAEERRQGRALEGGYATRSPRRLSQLLRALAGRRVGKNAANVNVLRWQGRLFALSEAGHPHELRPDDLHTLGETDLGGIVTASFTAHPHRIGSRATTFAFGVEVGPRNGLALYELPDSGPVRVLARVPLPFGTMVHDFAATPRHLVFLVSPLRLRLARLLLGLDGFAPSLAWEPERGTEVIVVPIDEPTRVVRFHTEAFFQWHFGAARERDGRILLDLVRYPDFASHRWLAAIKDGAPGFALDGTLHRAIVDPAARKLTLEERWAMPCEFPRVAPRTRRDRGDEPSAELWVATYSSAAAACATMPDRLARVNVETGAAKLVDLGPERFPSEPVLVRRPDTAPAGEGGYLLAHVYDARADRTGVVVLDTGRLDDGPLAWAWYDQPLPFTFHGGFAAAP